MWLLHLLLHLSQSGDRLELVRDQQRDQIPELLSAQFDLAAVVVYERDPPILGAVAVDHDLWSGVA